MDKITDNTCKNYDLLEEKIKEDRISGADVLMAFSNIFGLQLFTAERTEELLMEFGCID